MNNDFNHLTNHLAQSLIDLRSRRDLTQSALAKLVDLPRSTIANLESGQGNPSLIILAKLSAALKTPIDQLLSPQKSACSLTKAADTPLQERAQGSVKIYKLLPESLPTTNIERIEIAPGHQMKGMPHSPGTKEYFHCMTGEFTIRVSGVDYIVEKGDTLAFPGQVAHFYINGGKNVATGFSVVILAPLSI
jgi:transcriptional regulator with XRE-family HTH domain